MLQMAGIRDMDIRDMDSRDMDMSVGILARLVVVASLPGRKKGSTVR